MASKTEHKNRWIDVSRQRCALLSTLLLIGGSGAAARAAEPLLRMPEYGPGQPPPIRSRTEVDKLHAGSHSVDDQQPPLRLVLVAGPKDHGPGEHDYPAWQKVWSLLLAKDAHTEVQTADEFPTDEQFEWADVAVFYQRGRWDEERARALDPFLGQGGGAVYIHWAVDGRGGEVEMAKRIGLSALGGSIGYRHGPLHVDFSHNPRHPIARNLDSVDLVDESYWKLTGNPGSIDLLGTAVEEGQPRPLFWTVERGRGRVFVSIPGHYMWTFDDPVFRTILLRGIAWAGRRKVDRFNSLATLDARVE